MCAYNNTTCVKKCMLLPAMTVDPSKKHILAATLIPYLLNITPSLPTITQEETQSSMSQLVAQAILMQRAMSQLWNIMIMTLW